MRPHWALVFAIGCSSSSSPEATADASGADTAEETAAAFDTRPIDDAAVDADSAEAGPASLTLDEFAPQLAAAICADAAACCMPIADCQPAVEMRVRDAVKPGLVYDPKAAANCLAAYVGLAKCGDHANANAASSACSGVIDGTKNPGETCGSVEECRRGALGFSVGSGFVGCGSPKAGDPKVCIAFRATGDAGAACNMDLTGDGFERVLCKPGLACQSGACVKLPVAGEACTAAGCYASFCDMGTCKKLPAVGEACPGGACVADATCTSGTCVKDPGIIPFACLGFACPSDGSCK